MTIKINELIIKAKIDKDNDVPKVGSASSLKNDKDSGSEKTAELMSLNKINRER